MASLSSLGQTAEDYLNNGNAQFNQQNYVGAIESFTKAIALDPNFALAYYMVHEVPDPERLLSEIARTLAPGGRLLIVEPPAHVPRADFEKTLALARKNGLSTVGGAPIGRKLSALLEKPAG